MQMRTPTFGTLRCPQCSADLLLTWQRPQGSIVDRPFWECQGCGRSLPATLPQCSCGASAIDEACAASAPDLPVALNFGCGQIDYFGNLRSGNWWVPDNRLCTTCAVCSECKRKLARDYVCDGSLRLHSECHTALRALVDNLPARVEAERQRTKTEIEEQSARARIEAAEALRKERRETGLCVECGEALGFGDRFAHRIRHKHCQ